ncbi:MAG: hypothetical protein R3179_00585 [Sedimenticolaceae bacterium]|nr:hypothetical protein [Sedimenticolaceae bacterium]
MRTLLVRPLEHNGFGLLTPASGKFISRMQSRISGESLKSCFVSLPVTCGHHHFPVKQLLKATMSGFGSIRSQPAGGVNLRCWHGNCFQLGHGSRT